MLPPTLSISKKVKKQIELGKWKLHCHFSIWPICIRIFLQKKISSRDPPRFVYFCFFLLTMNFFWRVKPQIILEFIHGTFQELIIWFFQYSETKVPCEICFTKWLKNDLFLFKSAHVTLCNGHLSQTKNKYHQLC